MNDLLNFAANDLFNFAAGLNGYVLGAIFAAFPLFVASSLFNRRMFG